MIVDVVICMWLFICWVDIGLCINIYLYIGVGWYGLLRDIVIIVIKDDLLVFWGCWWSRAALVDLKWVWDLIYCSICMDGVYVVCSFIVQKCDHHIITLLPYTLTTNSSPPHKSTPNLAILFSPYITPYLQIPPT